MIFGNSYKIPKASPRMHSLIPTKRQEGEFAAGLETFLDLPTFFVFANLLVASRFSSNGTLVLEFQLRYLLTLRTK